jgi:hypothetical protein
VAVLLIVALELAARREGARIPSLADLGAVLLSLRVGRMPVGRLALLLLWSWVGWHFLAR